MVSAITYIIIFFASVSYLLLWFIYSKQYRFATYFTDLLPLYPYLSLFSGLFIITAILIVTDDSSIFILSTILIILLYTPQIYSFRSWYLGYQFTRYKDFLNQIISDRRYEIIDFDDVKEFPDVPDDKIWIIIRHDVDVFLSRSLNMIKLEIDLGVKSTYFFRNECEKYNFKDIIPIINDLKGSKIKVGFHYSTLTRTKGDINGARDLFRKEIETFRKIYPISAVAGHGDRFKNRDLVNNEIVDLEALELVSAYKVGHDVYISEAGGLHHFNRKNGKVSIHDLFDQLEGIQPGKLVQILIHPDWWF